MFYGAHRLEKTEKKHVIEEHGVRLDLNEIRIYKFDAEYFPVNLIEV